MGKNSVWCTPYLMGHTSYDFIFMVHMCKMIISPGVFFFIFFKMLILLVTIGVKGQEMVQNDNKFCLTHSIYQELYIIWSSFVVHICKMIISPCFFSKCWFSGLLEEVKQKIVQNDKIFCLLLSASQEPYIMSFVLHNCRMIISPGGFFFFFFFHFFKILIFWVVSGVKGQKMGQIDNKFCLWHSISQKPCIIWLPFMVHTCKMMVSPGFFTFLGGKMAKNGLKWEKNVCHAPYLRNHTSYDRHLLYTSVKWWYLQVFFFFFTFYFSAC